MQVEMSLAELLMNAIGNGRVPGIQFRRGWANERATFEGLKGVIKDRLDGARRVAVEEALRRAHDEHPVFKLRAENVRLRAALEKITTLGRVCSDFETCRHSSCQDSCGATLIALEALGAPVKRAP
jgi:acylphosphatase